MNSQFFLICFGVLGCYAVLRTMRRGWLRVLMVFFLVMCLVKIAFNAILPAPIYIAPQNVPTVSYANARDMFEAKLMALEDDRCIMSHLEDTPLGPVAYMLQAHQFMRNYRQAQSSAMAGGGGGGAGFGAMGQAISSTLGPQDAGSDSLCDRFIEWLQEQAQAQIQNVVHQ